MHTILAYTIAMNVHNINTKLFPIVCIICRLLCQTQNCAWIKFPQIDLQVPTDQLFKSGRSICRFLQINLQVPTDQSAGSYRSICRFLQINLQVPTDRSVGTYRSTINTSEKKCNTKRCFNAPHNYLARLVNQNKHKLKTQTCKQEYASAGWLKFLQCWDGLLFSNSPESKNGCGQVY